MFKEIVCTLGVSLLASPFLTNAEPFQISSSRAEPTFAAGVLSEEGKYAVAWQGDGAEGWIVDNVGKQYKKIQTNTLSEKLKPSQILPLADEQFLVVYNRIGYDGYGGYGQIYDGNGIMLGETVKLTEDIEERVESTEDIWSAVLANGNVVITWAEHHNNIYGDIQGATVYAQIFSPNLQKIGPPIKVSTDYSGSAISYRSDTRVTAFENGDFVVTFEANKFYGRRYTQSGYPKKNREFIIGEKADVDHEPQLLTLSDSRYVVAWTVWTNRVFGERKTYIQVLSENDVRLGEPYILTHNGNYRIEMEGLTKRSTRNFWVSYMFYQKGNYHLATVPFRLEKDNTLAPAGETLLLEDDANSHDDEWYNFIPERSGILLNYRANRYLNLSLDSDGRLSGEQLWTKDCEGGTGEWTQLCSSPAPQNDDDL
ncbi:hypothetical protein BTA51_14610 [Hahella sp. CCB-MM4]|uniref:hypothetical protein n=1 Tax=Hahella sp. (strain CCB-MM4) TaxID=1926491 RepID=UPI000B9A7C07|nr:hypothetical protein [Hahella sp. CCB-MM4]OZG72751.1 hypothetical protein BTA51_14610 [Hahella sp. CCB-MM4]